MRINQSNALIVTARTFSDPAMVDSANISFNSLTLTDDMIRILKENSIDPDSVAKDETWRNVQDFSSLNGLENNWVING